MTLNEQIEEFVAAIRAIPRDEMAAYISILTGLALVILAVIIW